ncbi:MAG: hypothetical protein IIW27_05745 [Clostridia bacterium]|nr:hypothetical protein [Clostridia bacterium]
MSSKVKRMSALTIACIAVALCVSLMAVGTYALFSETVTVSGHLQSGKLDASLSRVKLVKNELTDEGFIKESTDLTEVPDSQLTNVFGLSDTDKVAPGCSYVATMKISNNGNVAFGYYIKLKVTDGANSPMMDNIVVTVKKGDQTLTVGSDFSSNPIGVVAIGASEEFTVSVSFKTEAGNDTADQKVGFDLTVYAEQALAK